MKRLWFVLVPLGLIAIAGYVLVSTGPGLRFAARIAAPLIPGQLSYTALDGRLLGPLQISALDYRLGETHVALARGELQWQPLRLLSRHLHLNRLDLQGLEVHLAAKAEQEPEPQRGSFVLPTLPVTVTAEALVLDDAVIVQGDTVVPIQSLRLAAQLDGQRYRIDTLRLVSAPLDLSGEARIGLEKPHALAAALEWTARVERNGETSTVAGQVDAQGDLERLELSVATRGAVVANLAGTLTSLLDGAGLTARVAVSDIDPVLAGFDSTGLATTMDLRYDAGTIALDGNVAAPRFLPETATLQATTRLRDELVEFERLQLGFATLPTRIDATGTIRRDTNALDVSLSWTDLQWPLAGATLYTSPGGQATLSGTPTAYALRLEGTAQAQPLPAFAVSLRGRGDATSFGIDELLAGFDAAGKVQARGRIDWQESFSAELQLTGKDLALERFTQLTEGRADFDAGIVATFPDSGPRIDIALRDLSGQLRGRTLAGSGTLRYSAAQIRVDQLRLRAGDAHLDANGFIGEKVDLTWALTIPDLALLVPAYSGRLESRGVARGSRERPALEGVLSASGLSIASLAADALEGDFRLGVDDNTAARVALDATGLKVGALALGTVKARGDGTLRTHDLTVSVAGPAGTLDAQARGALEESLWRGTVLTLGLSRPGYGDWTLDAPAALVVGRAESALERACLRRDTAGVCLAGSFSPDRPWGGAFELDDFPLAFLAPFLPPGLEYEGALNGSGRIDSSATKELSGTARVALSPGRVLTYTDDEEDVLLGFEGGSVDAEFDSQGANTRLHLDLRETGILDADLRIPLKADAALAGTLFARVENLSIVSALVPQVGRIDGRVEARFGVTGTRSAPELSGQVALDATSISLPDLGITLAAALIKMDTSGNELRFEGSAKSGEGDVRLDGQLRFVAGKPTGEMRLAGDRFRAIDLPDIWLDASPEIKIAVADREIRIEGDVTVPAARITPIDIDTGVGVSSDQVIVGVAGNDTEEDAHWRTNGRVRVTAGDAVNIKAYGLQGRLTGSVLIIDRPGQPTIGRGSLEVIDGEYRAYGQKLTIEKGKLEFPGGPLDNPGIDLRAARDTGEVIAGVQVRGALRAPELSLYTVPPLSDSQSMSYLITGRGLEELDSAGQFEVNEAATKLALQGGSLLAASVGRGLGLDQVGLEDEGTTSSTSLVIGKHLSPRLFVSYGIGLFDALNTLRLRYQINPRLTLETESGARASADLLYSFER